MRRAATIFFWVFCTAFGEYAETPASIPDEVRDESEHPTLPEEEVPPARNGSIDDLHGPSALLIPIPKPVGSHSLLAEEDRAYARARWKLKSGDAAGALKALEGANDNVFADRVALIEGKAFERLKKFKFARDAYLEAVQNSESPAVSEAAVRGLISVSAKLGDYNGQLVYLDSLIAKLAPEVEGGLLLARANALAKLDRDDEARARAWELVELFPNAKSVEGATTLLENIGSKKLTTADRLRIEFSRIRQLSRTGKHALALKNLKVLRAKYPRAKFSIDLRMADVYRDSGSRARSDLVLRPLVKQRELGELRGGLLLRLARLAGDRYQYTRARKLFEELIANYPGTQDAIAGAYEYGEMEYESGQFASAAEKLLAFAEKNPESTLAPSALWYAGWSAHLSRSTPIALEAFNRLITQHGNTEFSERAEYWLARTHGRLGKKDAAVASYLRVADRNPLSYYGLLAQARLESLGAAGSVHAFPAISAPKTVDEVIALLGPSRPRGVDRAIVLFRSKVQPEAVEELLGVAEHYRRTGNELGATLIVDLFRIFDRDAWVFLLSRNIAQTDGEMLDERPHFWRVWRYAYPRPFEDEVKKAARDNKVDPLLVYSVMRTESLFRPYAVSTVGARGLMQLMPATAKWIGKVAPRGRAHAGSYKTPRSNIWLGSWFVKSLVERYRGNVAHALGAYNAGPSSVDRWRRNFGALESDEFIERTPYVETRNYMKRALESYMVYRKLYDAPSSLAFLGFKPPTERTAAAAPPPHRLDLAADIGPDLGVTRGAAREAPSIVPAVGRAH